ncbi:MAG: RNA methyltransferase [Leptolyngbyaceae cyanobacterium SM2_5_2]|nr:RNA methyltransferase [Leptolyngbyaceae cyanobacterium SM2_5_2]
MEPFRQSYATLPRHPLMVCAVLVENPMNLGGLCRTAEAFRLERLVLRDLSLARNRKFRQVAVTTHQWQPLAESSLEKSADLALPAASAGLPDCGAGRAGWGRVADAGHAAQTHGASAGARANRHSN